MASIFLVVAVVYVYKNAGKYSGLNMDERRGTAVYGYQNAGKYSNQFHISLYVTMKI